MTNIPTSMKSTIHNIKPIALLYSTSKIISSDFKSYTLLQIYDLNKNISIAEIKLPIILNECIFYNTNEDNSIEYIIGFGVDRLIALTYNYNLKNIDIPKKNLVDSFSNLNFNLQDLNQLNIPEPEVTPLEILYIKEFDNECIFDLNNSMKAIAVINNNKLGVISIDFNSKTIFGEILPANPKISNKVYSIAWNPIASHIIAIGYKNYVSIVDLRELNELTKIQFITNQSNNDIKNDSSSEITNQSNNELNDKIKKIEWFGKNNTSLLVMSRNNLYECSLLKEGIQRISRGGKSLIIKKFKIYSVFKEGIDILNFSYEKNNELIIKKETEIEIKEKIKSVSIENNLIILTSDCYTKIKTLDSLIFKIPFRIINVSNSILINEGNNLINKKFNDKLINKPIELFIKERLIKLIKKETNNILFNNEIINNLINEKTTYNNQLKVPKEFLINLINNKKDITILNNCDDFQSLLLISEYFNNFDILFLKSKDEADSLLFYLYIQYIKNKDKLILDLIIKLNDSLSEEIKRYYYLIIGDFNKFIELSNGKLFLNEYNQLLNCKDVDIKEFKLVKDLLVNNINDNHSNKLPNKLSSNIEDNKLSSFNKPIPLHCSGNNSSIGNNSFVSSNSSSIRPPMSPSIKPPMSPSIRPPNTSSIRPPVSPQIPSRNKIPQKITPPVYKTGSSSLNMPVKSAYIPPMEKPRIPQKTNYQLTEEDDILIKGEVDYLLNIAEAIKKKGSLIIRTKAIKCEKRLDDYKSSLKSDKLVSELKELLKVADLKNVLENIEDKSFRADLKSSLVIIKSMTEDISKKYTDSGIDSWVGSIFEILQCVCSLK